MLLVSLYVWATSSPVFNVMIYLTWNIISVKEIYLNNLHRVHDLLMFSPFRVNEIRMLIQILKHGMMVFLVQYLLVVLMRVNGTLHGL